MINGKDYNNPEDCQSESVPDVNTVKSYLLDVYNNAGNSIDKYMVLHELEKMIKELRISTSKSFSEE